MDDPELSRLSDALEKLAQVDSSLTEIVDLKFLDNASWNDRITWR